MKTWTRGRREAGRHRDAARAIRVPPTSSSRKAPATMRSSSRPGAAALISPARHRRQCRADPLGLGVRDAARAAAGCRHPRAGDRQGGGRHDHPQSGAGGGIARHDLPRFATMSRRTRPRPKASPALPSPRRTTRARRPTRCCAKGVGSVIVTLGEKGALLHTAAELGPRSRLQGRAGGRDDRRRRRLQRRPRRRPVARLRADRRRALRLRRRRHLGDPARHGAVDADARGGDEGLRGDASVVASKRCGAHGGSTSAIGECALEAAISSPHAAAEAPSPDIARSSDDTIAATVRRSRRREARPSSASPTACTHISRDIAARRWP